MLYDFLSLELYYDSPDCAVFFEDLSKAYGPERIYRAVQTGEITARLIRLGPDAGRRIFCLTEKGRRRAMRAQARSIQAR